MDKSKKSRFKDVITRCVKSRLMTKLGKKNITRKNAEDLLEGVISGKIGEKKSKKMYNNIVSDVNDLKKLGTAESRKKMLPIFEQVQEIFMGLKTDDKADDKSR